MQDYKFEFEGLIVYQKSLEFIQLVYSVTEKFPSSEKYTLAQQFTRAAHSIALNIGEGTGGTKPEFKNFLRIAKRSVRECVVCMTVASNQKFLHENDHKDYAPFA
jgi:four helix bundle protein